MKRLLALTVVVLFAVGAVSAFGTETKKEQNLVKIVGSTIKPGHVKEKNQLKNPLPTVTVFQHSADGIKEGSEKAKAESAQVAPVEATK